MDTEEIDESFDTVEEIDQTETFIEQASYVTVLTEAEIRRRMEDEIQKESDLISLPKAETTLLLSHFHWHVKRFHDEWFGDEKSVRKIVGILEPPDDVEEVVRLTEDTSLSETEGTGSKEFFCGCCFQSHPPENSASVSCGHLLCTFCWTSHINSIINETPAADWLLMLKCPYDFCPASVGLDMIENYASKKEKRKYNRYLLESYVENKKTMNWCPGAECSCAIEVSLGSGISDVTCSCLLRFCWNCSKDVHSPVDCRSAAKWLAMNTSDNQDPDWVLENTVPCPKCNRRIEENQDGSLKLTCLPPCNYIFCWRCRREWTYHRDEYTCNFDIFPNEESDQLWEMAQAAANRYGDCYENWQRHELLMQQAKANLKRLQTVIHDLCNTQIPTEPELEFILKAGLQIMESRRILKWTYAYEYYLRENEVEKKHFLNSMRADAETYLEKLEECVESEMAPFLEAMGPSPGFNSFRNKLTALTRVTRTHYESLIRDLEEGLANVVPALESSQRAYNDGEASGSGTNHDDD